MASGFLSFLRTAFRRVGAQPAAPAPATEYKGFSIRPAPRRQASQWLTAGVIAKQFPDGVKEYLFIRADAFADRDSAVACCITKAMLFIDYQGDHMFGGPGPRT